MTRKLNQYKTQIVFVHNLTKKLTSVFRMFHFHHNMKRNTFTIKTVMSVSFPHILGVFSGQGLKEDAKDVLKHNCMEKGCI